MYMAICMVRYTYSTRVTMHLRFIGNARYICIYAMLNKNTLGVKKVRGQSEATMVI